MELQDHLAEIESAGAHVLAVAVEEPRLTEGMRRLHGLTFPILSDRDAVLTSGYGLYDPGTDDALPATLLLDRDRTVLAAWRFEDPHRRPTMEELGAALGFRPEPPVARPFYTPEDGLFTPPPLPEDPRSTVVPAPPEPTER